MAACSYARGMQLSMALFSALTSHVLLMLWLEVVFDICTLGLEGARPWTVFWPEEVPGNLFAVRCRPKVWSRLTYGLRFSVFTPGPPAGDADEDWPKNPNLYTGFDASFHTFIRTL